MKKLILLIAAALVIWLIWPSKKKDGETKKSEFTSAVKSDEITIPPKPKLTPEQIVTADIAHYQEELGLMKTFNNKLFSGDLDALIIELAILENYAAKTNQALRYMNDSIKRIGIEMSKVLKSLQIKEYPRLRKEYVAISKEKLWVNDIVVFSPGPKYTTITYTGGIFAANANKQEFIEKLYKAFQRYRFKQIIFKWYEYDDRYTSYGVDSPADSEF